MTKTDAIKKYVNDEIERRRAVIEMSDLRAFKLDVHLSPESLEPRSVVFLPEFERRKAPRT